MKEELDTSWFDLKNYEAFKTMPITEWQRQLEMRFLYRQAFSDFQTYGYVYAREYYPGDSFFSQHLLHEEAAKYLLSIARILKSGVIPFDPNYFDRLQHSAECRLSDESFSTISVNSLSSNSLWSIVNEADSELDLIWEACKSSFITTDNTGCFNPTREQCEIIFRPHDLNIKKYLPHENRPVAHLDIDLTATDKQIINDFTHWLKHYRLAIGYYENAPRKKSIKKLCDKERYTQKDFDYWTKFCVIPYLDLMLIAKIEGKNITQLAMGELFFPDEYNKNPVGMISATTQPTAKWLIKSNMHKILSLQIVSDKQNRIK